MLLLAAILALSRGWFTLLWSVLGVAMAGLLVALFRDRSFKAIYRIEGERLILSARNAELIVSGRDISDASLIDRQGARDYIRSKTFRLREQGRAVEARELLRTFVRFCSVDIGMTSFTLGMGRRLIDRMPNAKHDLVLLRLLDGRDMLLSPVYNQDMVDSISRLVQGRDQEG